MMRAPTAPTPPYIHLYNLDEILFNLSSSDIPTEEVMVVLVAAGMCLCVMWMTHERIRQRREWEEWLRRERRGENT